MSIIEVLFWGLSALALLSAIMVLVSKNPVNSILWLIVTFIAISGHYALLNAQFLFIVNLIVYAGAVMVLFLFVIMLMNLDAAIEPKRSMWMKFAGIITGGMLLAVLLSVVRTSVDVTSKTTELNTGDIGLIKNLGHTLFTQYAIPFEISSVLFLSAMVGAVVIGKKN